MATDPLPAVYQALRRLAERRLAAERAGHTLTATALVHDAYLRLAAESPGRWVDDAHFFNAAAAAMRHVLVDHARAKLADRRGGHRQRVPLTAAIPDVATLAADGADADQVLALDRAVGRLAVVSPDAAAVVHLRFYAGLPVDAVATALGLSPATVARRWTYARLFLYRELATAESPGQSPGLTDIH